GRSSPARSSAPPPPTPEGRDPDRSIGEREEEPDGDAVGEERRAAVAHERERDPGERDDPQVPGRDDEGLNRDDEGETGGEEGSEVVGRRDGDPEPPLDDDEVAGEDRDDPDGPELLTDEGEGEVGVDRRDRRPPAERREPGAETRPEEPAPTERVERLDDLVAGPLWVGEGVEPDRDPGRD